jgi:hypothetical protein
VPEREDLYAVRVCGDSVIQAVPDSGEEQPTNASKREITRTGANSWLHGDETGRTFQFLTNHVWRSGPIRTPPFFDDPKPRQLCSSKPSDAHGRCGAPDPPSRVVLDTCILKPATFLADNYASALIYEFARADPAVAPRLIMRERFRPGLVPHGFASPLRVLGASAALPGDAITGATRNKSE